MLGAVLWDVDGTIAETERDGHRVAFNRAFEEHGFERRWDVPTYGRLLAIAGGVERLTHDLGPRDDAAVLARRLHETKNAAYAAIVAEGSIALRPGVRRVMDAVADAGIAQAIATTTSRANVAALLHGALGPDWSERFGAIVCAEEAQAKKPDPLVYRIALERLGMRADDAVAIEDSPNGVQAAIAAGIVTLVTRSDYFRDADFAGATAICDDLDQPVRALDGAWSRVDVDLLRRLVTRA